MIDYWFDLLFRSGVERALVNTHWLHDSVRSHVAGSPWRERVDLVFEPELLGTGGTVLANAHWVGNEPFLLAHADNLTNFDLDEFRHRHSARPRHCLVTMLAFRTDMPKTCGILETAPDGTVVAFHEKVEDPPGNLANAAVYICEPEILAYLDGLGRTVIDLSTEVLPEFVGRIYAVETSGYHRDIGSPESLALAEREFLA